MSENGIDSENVTSPTPDTGKPKGARKPAGALIRRSLEQLNASRVFWFIDSAYSGAAAPNIR
jgi:hypothetical protein